MGESDDVRELGAAPKLAGQIAAATIPVVAGVTVESLNFLGFTTPSLGWASYPLTALGIVAIANMINFIDGLCAIAEVLLDRSHCAGEATGVVNTVRSGASTPTASRRARIYFMAFGTS